VQIHFAHRTFQWNSEARGKAAVHCVIVGFGLQDVPEKWLFDYDTPRSEPHAVVVVEKRMRPLCFVPEIVFGSKAVDFGHFVIEFDELDNFLLVEPTAKPYIREFIGGDEFINDKKRYCLWLKGVAPQVLRSMPFVMKRIEAVKDERLRSVKASTRKLALTPAEFGEDRQPDTPYLLIPKVSSENRYYVPLGFMTPEKIINPTVLIIPNASIYDFGVLQSTMHMAWMRAVCGRMKSDYQYSATIVYNTFPWPAPTDKQHNAIETAAQSVLDGRARFPEATLADLYDPLTMPPVLLSAHQVLDRAVDAAYGVRVFNSEARRVAFLFEQYQKMIEQP